MKNMGFLSCPLCEHVTLSDLQELQQKIAKSLTRNLTCPICSSIIQGITSLHYHLAGHIPIKMPAILAAVNPPSPEQIPSLEKLEIRDEARCYSGPRNVDFSPSNDSTLGKSTEVLTESPETERPKQFNCNLCGLVFSSDYFLSLHKDIIHSNSNGFDVTCKLCQSSFKDIQEYRNHVQEVHSERRYICDRCPKSFKKKGGLLVHTRMYHDNSSHSVCQVCQKHFTSKALKELHEKRYHANNRHFQDAGPSKLCQEATPSAIGDAKNCLETLMNYANQSQNKSSNISQQNPDPQKVVETIKITPCHKQSPTIFNSYSMEEKKLLNKNCLNSLSNKIVKHTEVQKCSHEGFSNGSNIITEVPISSVTPKNSSKPKVSRNNSQKLKNSSKTRNDGSPTEICPADSISDPILVQLASLGPPPACNISQPALISEILQKQKSLQVSDTISLPVPLQRTPYLHNHQEATVIGNQNNTAAISPSIQPPEYMKLLNQMYLKPNKDGAVTYKKQEPENGVLNVPNESIVKPHSEKSKDACSNDSQHHHSQLSCQSESPTLLKNDGTDYMLVGGLNSAAIIDSRPLNNPLPQVGNYIISIPPNVNITAPVHKNKNEIKDVNVQIEEQNDVNDNEICAMDDESSKSPVSCNKKEEMGCSKSDNKQWECETCKKCFTTKYFLKKHKRLHTGETPYSCEECGKTFAFQQSYHKHIFYHSDDKPHLCPHCGRAFKEMSTLHNHIRIHTGEKPFVCDTCGKAFRQRVSYFVHQRIHTGQMPYKCEACDRVFRYKVSLRSHKCSGKLTSILPNQIDTSPLMESTNMANPSSPAIAALKETPQTVPIDNILPIHEANNVNGNKATLATTAPTKAIPLNWFQVNTNANNIGQSESSRPADESPSNSSANTTSTKCLKVDSNTGGSQEPHKPENNIREDSHQGENMEITNDAPMDTDLENEIFLSSLFS